MAGNEASIWQPRTVLQTSADTKRVVQRFTAVAGQTLFNLTEFAYAVGVGSLEVYRQNSDLSKAGTRALILGTEYVEQTDTSFALTKAAVVGEQIYAVAYVGITASVDVRDTDIFVTNYQAIRDYAGTEITLYAQGKVTLADGGEDFFQKLTGMAPGFFVDNNDTIIVPTGGDGSIGWVHRANSYTSTATVATMKLLGGLTAGSTVVETAVNNTTSNAGAGVYDVITGTGTADEIDVIAHDNLNLSFKLRVNGPVLITQGGGIGNGVFDNLAIHNKLQSRASVIILPSNTGAEVYNFSAPPAVGANLITVMERGVNISGITKEQVNGWTPGGIGVPTIKELSTTAGSVAGKKVEIVAGVIKGDQAAGVTITRTGAIATVTKVAHGYPNGARAIHKGAVETEYNITATISNVTANTYDYTVSGTPATPATGSPTARNPAIWNFIKDASHEPVGVVDSGPLTAVGSLLTVPFTDTYTKTLYLAVSPDETFANAHNLSVGASVGLSSFVIKAGISIHGASTIRWDGAAWNTASGSGQILNFVTNEASGVLTITHDYCPGIGVSIAPFSLSDTFVPYQPFIVSVANNQLQVAFRAPGAVAKYTGVKVVEQSFLLTKSYHEGILLDGSGDSDTLDLSTGNLWFYGIFLV